MVTVVTNSVIRKTIKVNINIRAKIVLLMGLKGMLMKDLTLVWDFICDMMHEYNHCIQ